MSWDGSVTNLAESSCHLARPFKLFEHTQLFTRNKQKQKEKKQKKTKKKQKQKKKKKQEKCGFGTCG